MKKFRQPIMCGIALATASAYAQTPPPKEPEMITVAVVGTSIKGAKTTRAELFPNVSIGDAPVVKPK